MTLFTLQNVIKRAADLDTVYELAITSGVVYEVCKNAPRVHLNNKNMLLERPLVTVLDGLILGAGTCVGVWLVSKVFGNSKIVNTSMSVVLGIASVGYVARAGIALLKNKKSADRSLANNQIRYHPPSSSGDVSPPTTFSGDVVFAPDVGVTLTTKHTDSE